MEDFTNNVYALDITNTPIHISDAESGRKGYYCMGCGREMQAKKGNIKMHHFSHDPKDVEIKGKCSYSDETHRHKLAKEILQRIKQIKVPALYKYPPFGAIGKPYKIKDARVISAHKVRNELCFYENESGQICFSASASSMNPDVINMIQPDVTFFDSDNNPILFIEIEVTHKIDPIKLIKIRRLGVDTIQVTIPKGSPEEIENTFFRTERTKWVYSYEQEKANYLPTPQGDSEGVPSIDELQRKFFAAGESYECRAAAVKNLIRAIRKCLESEPYRVSEREIRTELQRVEGNTESHRIRLQHLEEQHKVAIATEFRSKEELIGGEEEEFGREENEFEAEYTDLERRYFAKKGELEAEEDNYRPECQPRIDRGRAELAKLGWGGKSIAERRFELIRDSERLEEEVRREQNYISESSAEENAKIGGIEQEINSLPGEYSKAEGRLRSDFERDKEKLEREFRNDEEELRRRVESDRRSIVAAIETRDSEGASRARTGIRSILDSRERLLHISEGKGRIRTLERLKELFRSGAYKDWK